MLLEARSTFQIVGRSPLDRQKRERGSCWKTERSLTAFTAIIRALRGELFEPCHGIRFGGRPSCASL